MGIKYKLIITDRAKKELNEIYNYISNSLMANNAADSLLRDFEEKIIRLEEMPESCSVIDYYKDKKYNYRKLLIRNYVAIYRIDYKNKIVYIARVIYGGRNYLNEI